LGCIGVKETLILIVLFAGYLVNTLDIAKLAFPD